MNRDDVEILSSRRAWDGHFKLDVHRLRHRLHAGGWGPEIEREVLERGHAVGVLPYDPQRDRVVLIEQFRPGALTAPDPDMPLWLLEVVAGIIDPGETLEAVARRETEEESGLQVSALAPICRYYVSPGCTSETLMLYCGRVDAGAAGGIYGLADEHEDIRVVVLDAPAAFAALANGTICNSAAIIALQWLALNRPALRARWAADPNNNTEI